MWQVLLLVLNLFLTAVSGYLFHAGRRAYSNALEKVPVLFALFAAVHVGGLLYLLADEEARHIFIIVSSLLIPAGTAASFHRIYRRRVSMLQRMAAILTDPTRPPREVQRALAAFDADGDMEFDVDEIHGLIKVSTALHRPPSRTSTALHRPPSRTSTAHHRLPAASAPPSPFLQALRPMDTTREIKRLVRNVEMPPGMGIHVDELQVKLPHLTRST